MRPKISICIPTYNQKPEYLRQCVQSALQQRYDSLEVVVSENHSSNEAPVVLSEFEDPRLKLVKPPVHLNMAGNFAFCFSQSTGEYLNFLSSDDLLHPDFCMRMAAILDGHPNVAFAHAAVGRINSEGRVIGYEKSIDPSFIRSGLKEFQRYIWGHRNVFIAALTRRTAFEEAGGVVSEELELVGDWYLSLRLLLLGDVAYCSDVLAYYRDWSNPRWHIQFRQWVRNVRVLYEKLESSDMIVRIDGGLDTLYKARKRYAVVMAESIPTSDLSPTELAQAVQDIRLFNDSFAVRARLFLVRAGLGPLFWARKRVREWLRQHVKSFLYPRPLSDEV